MEQNIVVEWIDEELERLRQLRAIFASLLPETEFPSIHSLQALEAEVRAEDAAHLEQQGSETSDPDVQARPEAASKQGAAPVRKASRRGIRTGPRGPRQRTPEAAPRALDNIVPTGPVVVSPGSRPVVVPAVAKRPVVKKAPVDKLDSLLAAAFATLPQATTVDERS